eukprot:194462-Rhodomonas_salina.2
MAMKRQSDALLEDAQAEKKQLEATLLDLRAEVMASFDAEAFARDAVTTIKQKCRLLEKAKTDLETEVSDLSVRLLKVCRPQIGLQLH